MTGPGRSGRGENGCGGDGRDCRRRQGLRGGVNPVREETMIGAAGAGAMKIFSVLAGMAGAAAIVALVAYFGVGDVVQSLLAVGVAGFLAVCAMQLALTAGLGLAWTALLPGVALHKPIWARLVRDSAAEALP